MRFVGRAGLILVVAFVLAAFCGGSVAFAREKVVSKKPITKKHVSLEKSRVKDVQQALVAAGFKTTVSGIFGPKTRRALKAYQKKNGLKITGRMDKATLNKMRVN